MRGRWVFTSPVLLIAAMLAPALPLGALVLLGGLALTVVALVVANRWSGTSVRKIRPATTVTSLGAAKSAPWGAPIGRARPHRTV